MPTRRAILNIAVCLSLQSVCALPAWCGTIIEDAVDHFTNKRFHAAEAAFEQAALKEPSDQRIFLMIGKTREELKDLPGAKEAYNAAFFINPFSEEGKQAKQAVLDTEAKIQAKAHAPLDDPETMRQSARTIQAQSSELGQNKINYGNALARDKINDNLYLDGGYKWGSGYVLGTTPGGYRNFRRRGEVSNWDVVRRAGIQMDNQTQALHYGANAAKAATEVQSSANNLVSLLADHSKSSAPHLRAAGTNLYVRNYAVPGEDELPPVDPPIEMKAVQFTLFNMPKELRATAQKL